MKNQSLGILIIRLSLGILMLLHGIAKLSQGVAGIENMLESKGIPGFVAYGVYIGEVIAPLLLIVGYRTRIAAILLFLNMLVIVFIAHPENLLSVSSHGGWKMELAGLYLFGSLALIFMGGGDYALSSKNKWD
ncbi:MAG: DoxX family protein [Crocinitomicaceae bacterium]